MAEEVTSPTTMDRRELLQRGALVGGAGALMWAAPSVTRFGSPAFGSTAGTPEGKDFSYIALRYQCGDDPTVYSIKFEFADGDKCGVGPSPCVEKCETGNFSTPRGENTNCTFTTGASRLEDCTNDKFTIEYLDGLKKIKITINGTGECILDGVGVGKCGSPASVDEPCVYEVVDGASSVTFDLCGVSVTS